MLDTTVGQVLINHGLPPELRDYRRVMDKKGIKTFLSKIAQEHPEKYKEVVNHLMEAGRSIAGTKGLSVSLKHLLPSQKKIELVGKLRAENQRDIDNDALSDEERDKRILARTAKLYSQLQDAMMEEASANGSPYALQVKSGGRGNASQHNSLVGADLLVSDHRNQLVPMPIYNSYSDGLDPVEYWSSVYGTRRGQVAVKFATAEAGFFGKQLALAAHRQVVTDETPHKTRVPVGLPVELSDPDNDGAVLAVDTKGYPAGTVLSPKILADLKSKMDPKDRLLIHSPMTAISEDGGIDRWSAGRRDGNGLSAIGTNVGITSAQSISEPLSQGTLNEKHSAGAGNANKNRGGFEYINKLFQAPEFFAESGPLAPVQGRVQAIEVAPQGGHYVHIGKEKIYIRPDHNLVVKVGQELEPGDDLTDAVPHPAELVKYRGIGEARRTFLNLARDAFKSSGLEVNRRNLEPIVAGLMNHVRITAPDGVGGHLVDDVVPYGRLAHGYQGRQGAKVVPIKSAYGHYLEEPALHYTPGTRVNQRVMDDLNAFGVKDINVHHEPPEFEPHFERLMTNTSHDPDWQTRLGGFYIGRSFTKAVHRGLESNPESTSFFPALAQTGNFGSKLKTEGRY